MITLKDPGLLKPLSLIDGQWLAADNGALLPVCNPANGQIIAQVPACGAAETGRAIAAAAAALPAWRKKTAHERSRILRRWFELVLANKDDLALLMTLEQGKPFLEARGEIIYAASFLEWFAEEGKRAYGEVLPSPTANSRMLVVKQPVGVCAAITPWNFPSAMITRKAGPALAAGCTMILKPAEQTPLSALALAELALRAGVPAGVFNVVTGDPVAIGGELTASPVVRKLSFTGSTEVGRLLMAQCAPTLKKLSLELGGNAPFIVFDDADIDAAVAGAVAAKFRNAGQTCISANRFYVQAGVYDAFAEKLAAVVTGIKVGNGQDKEVTQGPLIDAAALTKVETLVADAQAKGATVLLGGRRHALGGTWYEPTILSGATAAMSIAREEIFGPVAPLFRFDNEADVIAQANATEYGLAAYFYSSDIGRVWRLAEALEYGMVGINSTAISSENAPFGGIKNSGMGREGARVGLDEYLEIKSLSMGGL